MVLLCFGLAGSLILRVYGLDFSQDFRSLQGRCFLVLRFYQPDSFRYCWSLRGPYLSLHDERYGRKACQRAPKPPFGIWLLYGGMRGDVLASYEFAQMQLTRFRPVRRRAGGVRFEKPSTTFVQHAARLQALLPPDSVVLLQLRRIRNTHRITAVVQSCQSGGCGSLSIFLSSAARRGEGISGAPKPT